MSEENSRQEGQEDVQVDFAQVYEEKLKNTKAEFNRKIDNLVAIQQELVTAITNMSTKSNGQITEDDGEIDDLLIRDPKKAVSKLKKEMRQEVMSEIQQQNQISQEQQAVLSAIMQDFPELGDPNHDLTQKTVEIYGKMSEKEKKLPMSYKVAAREAADALSILPKRYRSAENHDSFTLNGKNSAPREKKAKVDDATIAFAQAMGLDINNKEVLERISKHSKRNFLSWS